MSDEIDEITAVTWERLAAAEPELLRLEAETRWMANHAGDNACANEVWYGFLKPQLVRLVGHARGYVPRNALDDGRPMFVAFDADFWDRQKVAASTHAERLLRSAEAYDVVYEHLYELLPDCRHEGACRG